MMTCKDYIFKLTSGQLAEAGRVERLWAAQHRLICRHCRAFTRNDRRLDDILQGYKAHLSTPDEPSDD
jgi:hypothetical protein